MADRSITITITHDPDSSEHPFHWAFSDDNIPLEPGTEILKTPADQVRTLQLTLVSDNTNDSVIFRSTPVRFKNGNLEVIPNPSWYSFTPDTTAENIIVITDDNDPAVAVEETFKLFLQADYTPQGEPEIHIESPDPTIVNAGTGGDSWSRHWLSPVPHGVAEPPLRKQAEKEQAGI